MEKGSVRKREKAREKLTGKLYMHFPHSQLEHKS